MMGEVFQNLRKATERFFMIYEVTCRHSAIANDFQSPPNVVRRVMKRGFASDFGIVEQVRVKPHFSSRLDILQRN